MNNPNFDLLMFARGPLFDIALLIFVAGVLIRVVEILVLGRKKDFSKAKGKPVQQGVKTIFTRTLPRPGAIKANPITIVGGYVFHIGFFIAFLLFVPHIALIEELTGLSWPGVGRVLIESATVLAIIAGLALIYTRWRDPVRRKLTTWVDYLLLVLCLLPLITGYVAVNKLFGDPTYMMALHILSVDILMIVFPFTKLMHAFTSPMARYYNGSIQGRKGAES